MRIAVATRTSVIKLVGLSTTCPHEQSVSVFSFRPACVSHLHLHAPLEHSNESSNFTEKGVFRKSIWACASFVVHTNVEILKKCLIAIITILKYGMYTSKAPKVGYPAGKTNPCNRLNER